MFPRTLFYLCLCPLAPRQPSVLKLELPNILHSFHSSPACHIRSMSPQAPPASKAVPETSWNQAGTIHFLQFRHTKVLWNLLETPWHLPFAERTDIHRDLKQKKLTFLIFLVFPCGTPMEPLWNPPGTLHLLQFRYAGTPWNPLGTPRNPLFPSRNPLIHSSNIILYKEVYTQNASSPPLPAPLCF